VIAMLVGLTLHPRRTLDAAAAAPKLAAGALAVAATGVLSLGLGLLAAGLGEGGTAAVVLSIAVPVMLAAFWLVSALLVGAGARLMGLSGGRRELLAVSGLTFPPLVLYAAVAVLQAASLHWGGDMLSTLAGWVALPVVGWFVALNALAVRAVYELPALSAVAIALLPYAALSGVLLVIIVVLSILHSAGAV
jgi:hypothetical protein